MCNDYYPELEENMQQSQGENLKLDVPWQPDVVIAHKFVLCDQCKALRKITPNFNNPRCVYCTRKTYNWARKPEFRQGDIDG